MVGCITTMVLNILEDRYISIKSSGNSDENGNGSEKLISSG